MHGRDKIKDVLNDEEVSPESKKQLQQVVEGVDKLYQQGEDTGRLQEKLDRLKEDTQFAFKKIEHPKPQEKGFFARLFSCLPCCGADDVDVNEHKPLLGNKR